MGWLENEYLLQNYVNSPGPSNITAHSPRNRGPHVGKHCLNILMWVP